MVAGYPVKTAFVVVRTHYKGRNFASLSKLLLLVFQSEAFANPEISLQYATSTAEWFAVSPGRSDGYRRV